MISQRLRSLEVRLRHQSHQNIATELRKIHFVAFVAPAGRRAPKLDEYVGLEGHLGRVILHLDSLLNLLVNCVLVSLLQKLLKKVDESVLFSLLVRLDKHLN